MNKTTYNFEKIPVIKRNNLSKINKNIFKEKLIYKIIKYIKCKFKKTNPVNFTWEYTTEDNKSENYFKDCFKP